MIVDVGGEDAARFYDGINRQSEAPLAGPSGVALTSGEADMLPVVTPVLTPGPVVARALRLPGLGALFLLGDDALSRDWLSRNAAALARHHAVGMVVNVVSADALRSLRKQAGGIMLVPASGSALAGRLQLNHYPVLITDTGLTQEPVW